MNDDSAEDGIAASTPLVVAGGLYRPVL